MPPEFVDSLNAYSEFYFIPLILFNVLLNRIPKKKKIKEEEGKSKGGKATRKSLLASQGSFVKNKKYYFYKR